MTQDQEQEKRVVLEFFKSLLLRHCKLSVLRNTVSGGNEGRFISVTAELF